jgi:thiosulfate/3-mercaptopyruvate sulfurtransferase
MSMTLIRPAAALALVALALPCVSASAQQAAAQGPSAQRASARHASAQRPSAQQGASARDRLVVTPAWLAQHLNDRDLVILQVGRKETYDAGHIPGARFVNYDGGALAAPRDNSGRDPNYLVLEMPAPDALRTELAALGISDNSRIVVVPADEYWSPSTRVVLTLDYAGLSNVSWLDGGLKGWTDQGRSLSTAVPEPNPGSLGALKIKPVVVDAAFVSAHIGKAGFAIVDARTRNFYDGVPPQRASGAIPPKPGHIPGALSAPYNEFATADGGLTKLKAADEIAALLTKAGVKPGDTIIGYCHIGQQATALLFAARTAGYQVLLYDGSFTDWQRRDLPVENPSAKKDQ